MKVIVTNLLIGKLQLKLALKQMIRLGSLEHYLFAKMLYTVQLEI